MKTFNKLLDERAVMFMNEKNIDALRFQGVIDAMYRKGFNKGFTSGYFGGVILTVSLLAVARVWRTLGRLEGIEKGAKESAKEAAFWRKLYSFNAESRFRKNCESSDKKSSIDEEDIDGDTESQDDPGDAYDRMHEEGKC